MLWPFFLWLTLTLSLSYSSLHGNQLIIISCCWFHMCTSLMTLHVSLCSTQVAWVSLGWGSPSCWGKICTDHRSCAHSWQTAGGQTHCNNFRAVFGKFSSCVTSGFCFFCFVERGLERTTSFCPTSGNLQATFSTAVSRLWIMQQLIRFTQESFSTTFHF